MGRRDLLLVTAFSPSEVQELRVGGNWSRKRAEARRSAAHWLAPHDLLSLLLYNPGPPAPPAGTTYSGLGPPASIINAEHAPQTCL